MPTADDEPRRKGCLAGARSRAAFLIFLACCALDCGRLPAGYLELTIVEAISGEIIPARVEVLDQNGQPHMAAEALRVAGDCGWLPFHNWIAWAARWQMRRALQAEVANPFTGTTNFYLTRTARMRLPLGRYTVRVFTGSTRRITRSWLSMARP